MHSFIRGIPFLCFLLFSSTQAYEIDDSCALPTKILVRQAANQAFAMARVALQELQASPRDPDVNRLLGLLFGRKDEDPATMNVKRLRDIYDNILLAAAEDEARPHPTDNSPLQNVMIYCNEDRIQKRPDGTWVDTVSQVIPVGGKECTAKDFTTMAYTMVPGRAVFENHPSQITICPWFFQWARQKKYLKYADTQKGVAKAFARRTWEAMLRSLGREDGIDKMRLLDQTILHELTHTLVGGRSLDVKVAGPFGSEKSYGWKNCLALAKNGGMHPEDDKLPRTALDNADSLAFFGLAVKLLREQVPLYVLENGGLTNRRP